MAPFLSIEGVTKEFLVRGTRIAALDAVSLAVKEREFVTVIARRNDHCRADRRTLQRGD
jgi:ABC-type oligopeptide transport system ATPase subunit